MKPFLIYLHQYYLSLNKKVFLFTSLLVALLIVINYTIGIEPRINSFSFYPERFSGFFLLYSFTLCFAYWIHFTITRHYWPRDYTFIILMLIAAAIFAWKISSQNLAHSLTRNLSPDWRRYWNIVADWPLKSIVQLVLIGIIWKLFSLHTPVAGMTRKNFTLKPYLLLLLLMLPLIGFAATQEQFLNAYPKLKMVDFISRLSEQPWRERLLFELSYGSDFFGIELFFRGFVVLAFVRYAGKDAILPMAAFYCTIHFGKPLLECISSYFGGLILGVLVYRTQTIWGGLITHLGIAWLMEMAGYWMRYH